MKLKNNMKVNKIFIAYNGNNKAIDYFYCPDQQCCDMSCLSIQDIVNDLRKNDQYTSTLDEIRNTPIICDFIYNFRLSMKYIKENSLYRK